MFHWANSLDRGSAERIVMLVVGTLLILPFAIRQIRIGRRQAPLRPEVIRAQARIIVLVGIASLIVMYVGGTALFVAGGGTLTVRAEVIIVGIFVLIGAFGCGVVWLGTALALRRSERYYQAHPHHHRHRDGS